MRNDVKARSHFCGTHLNEMISKYLLKQGMMQVTTTMAKKKQK